MKKQSLVLGLILGGCVAAVACSSSDDSSPSNTGGSGGSGGKSGSGGTHAGGTTNGGAPAGGSATGGTSAGKGGTASGATAGASEGGESGAPTTSEGGAGGEAGGGGGGFVFPPSLNAQFVIVPSAAPATQNHLIVAGTDYVQTEVASITLAPAAVGDTTTYMDGDTIAVSSSGVGFVLERSNDKAHLLDGGKIKTTFDLTDVGTDTAALTENKAYIGLLNQSLISILDLASGKVSRRIDLSQFNVASDTDGSADVTAGAYDATKKIAYFVLARFDRNSIVAPDYLLPCTATKALVVGVDATTDALVDINGAAAGVAFELSLVAPETLAISTDGKTLTLLDNGCFDGGVRKNGGVEVVDLTANTSKAAYTATTSTDFLDNLVVIDPSTALIHGYAYAWNKLNLATGVLGDTLLNVPDSPTFDGINVLGVKVTGNVGSVVRYTVASDSVSTVTATSWSGQFSATSGTALVK